MVKTRKTECFYKNDCMAVRENQTDAELGQAYARNVSQKIFLANCDQSYIECLRTKVFVPIFERSSEDSIVIVVNIIVIKRAIGNLS